MSIIRQKKRPDDQHGPTVRPSDKPVSNSNAATACKIRRIHFSFSGGYQTYKFQNTAATGDIDARMIRTHGEYSSRRSVTAALCGNFCFYKLND